MARTASGLTVASVRADVTGTDVDVRLRLLPAEESLALASGVGRPPMGLGWDPGYPTSDTFVALGLLQLAHDAAGTDPTNRRWWLHQIVARTAEGTSGEDVVVGDIGFHGPPEPGSRAVVEIGYAVVPAWQGRGVATRACALILDQAWRDGADLVQAEAEGPASQAVLRKCGFRHRDGAWFEVGRP